MTLKRAPPLNIRGNILLAAIDSADLAVLVPHFQVAELKRQTVIERNSRNIQTVYFPVSGMASTICKGSGAKNQWIEAGIFGREGMSGTCVVLGVVRAEHEVYVQMPGMALTLPANVLQNAMIERPSLRSKMLHFVHSLHLQVTYTALANGKGTTESRLARWLLMAHDRVEGDELTLTHESLGLMLGVHRPSVTTALRSFEQIGCVRARRGIINVTDRAGLRGIAGQFYGKAEAEYERLFGHPIFKA